MTDHNIRFDDSTIRAKAFALWENRGRPAGSPETDWFEAERQLIADAQAQLEREREVRLAAERAAEAAIERAKREAIARAEVQKVELAPSSRPPRNALLHVVPKEPLAAPKVPAAIANIAPQPKAAGGKRKR